MATNIATYVIDHHWQVIDPRWNVPLEDPFWRIYLQDGAGAEVVMDQRRFALVPGHLYLIPAWLSARTACVGTVEHHWMHVLPGDPWVKGSRAPFPLGEVLQHPWMLPDQRLAARFRELRELPRGGTRAQTRALAIALGAFDLLADHLGDEVQAMLSAGSSDDRMTPVMRYIESHLGDDLTLAFLASYAGLSASRFHAVFQAKTGRTPMAWIRERRLQAAAQRLVHGTESIEEIARIAGFSNRGNFTRAFSDFHGQSPGAFRLRVRQEQESAQDPSGTTEQDQGATGSA
jgi:AraC-like DNA-binding protein